MRIIDEQGNEITQEQADPSLGTICKTTIIRPEATPIDNITKYAYADEDYEDVIIYTRTPDDVLTANRIAELKRNLADTDYVAIKIAEGVATAEEYSEVLASRREWRAEINRLEETL